MSNNVIFAYGYISGAPNTNCVNLVSDTGVVGNDIVNVGTCRAFLAGAGYGSGCAVFAYGITLGQTVNLTNLVSDTGTVSSDITGVGIPRMGLAAAGYGSGRVIFAYGNSECIHTTELGNGLINFASLLNSFAVMTDTGIIGHDCVGVGTAREGLAAAEYGAGRAIFAHGYNGTNLNLSNSVSDSGVVEQDVAIVGTSRRYLAASKFGTGQAIFGYGGTGAGECNYTNLVSDTGVVTNDIVNVGMNRVDLAAAGYGGDRAIFGFGLGGKDLDISIDQISLVSNTGVVSEDRVTVGTGRFGHAAGGYGVA